MEGITEMEFKVCHHWYCTNKYQNTVERGEGKGREGKGRGGKGRKEKDKEEEYVQNPEHNMYVVIYYGCVHTLKLYF